MSSKGFTKSYRSKWTHLVFRNLLEAGIWAWLCDTAAWENTKVKFNGDIISLKRGQLVTSVKFISTGFNISERATRTLLQNLEKEQMIDKQTTNRMTIITICNYEKYQTFEKASDELTDKQPTNSRQTADNNNKEDKEDNNYKETNNSIDPLQKIKVPNPPPEDWIKESINFKNWNRNIAINVWNNFATSRYFADKEKTLSAWKLEWAKWYSKENYTKKNQKQQFKIEDIYEERKMQFKTIL